MVKEKYIVLFVVRSGKSFTLYKKKKIDAQTKTVSSGYGNSHYIDVQNPTYSMGLKRFYVVEILFGQLTMKKWFDKKYNSATIDLVHRQQVIRQFSTNLGKGSFGLGYMMIVALLGFGAFIGYVLRGYLG